MNLGFWRIRSTDISAELISTTSPLSVVPEQYGSTDLSGMSRILQEAFMP
nr:hypothetical protein CDS [Bradyrhizobium sp.]CUT16737.1 hypothetical protein CDS [Bradyrhizobium sp.]